MARTELAGWTADLRGGISAADRAIEVSQEVGSHALTGWTHAFASRLCAAHRDAAIALGTRLNEPGPYVWSTHAYAHLLLSTGKYPEAAELLTPLAGFCASMGFAGIGAIPLQPDHVEVLARCGRSAEAEVVLRDWAATMPSEPDDWHRAVLARCRVLVHGESHVDDLVAALESGALRLTPLEEARAQLVAGVALRRKRRPTAAQDQEMRVAHEIATGATTSEAATRLFCSPKTVEYHLTRVYAKLGVRTRAALASRVTAAAGAGPTA